MLEEVAAYLVLGPLLVAVLAIAAAAAWTLHRRQPAPVRAEKDSSLTD